jgi:Interferon-induced transmembrane protein
LWEGPSPGEVPGGTSVPTARGYVGTTRCRRGRSRRPLRQKVPGPPQRVPTYLVPAILTTVFCCLPAGIVAIVHAAQVNTKLAHGDITGAKQASKNARTWSWISFGVTVVFLVIALVVGAATEQGGTG